MLSVVRSKYMSFIGRQAVRTIARSTPRARFASTSAEGSYAAQQAELKAHAAETTALWRKISFYVCVPAIAICVAWVRNVEAEHEQHQEHLKEENGGKLPPTPNYDYLNRRAKPFPWGNNSLFFNPKTNKDMNESE